MWNLEAGPNADKFAIHLEERPDHFHLALGAAVLLFCHCQQLLFSPEQLEP